MAVYKSDVMIIATAYVRADSKSEALALVKGLNMTCLEVPEGEYEEIIISSMSFGKDELPKVSLSPMMTVYAEDDTTYTIGPPTVEEVC